MMFRYSAKFLSDSKNLKDKPPTRSKHRGIASVTRRVPPGEILNNPRRQAPLMKNHPRRESKALTI